MNKMRSQKTGKAKQRRKGLRLRHYKRSIFLICAVLVCLSGSLAVSSVRLQEKNAQYKAQEEELEAQIKEEKKRTEEVKQYAEYVKTDDYIKDTAEDKLGLVDPNEIIFKPSE
ncbi:MAG TPA: septum formation initiator family protein [Candidatus Mediterraneibacter merdavium]|nr:septum formation initiator family protein [Candidatus Mediterraneibacter merdavium]